MGVDSDTLSPLLFGVVLSLKCLESTDLEGLRSVVESSVLAIPAPQLIPTFFLVLGGALPPDNYLLEPILYLEYLQLLLVEWEK